MQLRQILDFLDKSGKIRKNNKYFSIIIEQDIRITMNTYIIM